MEDENDPKPQKESELKTISAFLILRRRIREITDPLESKLAPEYVLGHLTNLTESQIIRIRDQIYELARRYGALNEVIALLDSFDANNQARRQELLSMAKNMKCLLNNKGQERELEILWPHRLALVVDEMAGAYQKENAKLKYKNSNKALGRKAKYDPVIDRKIADVWKSKQHSTFLELAKARGKGESAKDIRLAVQRVRKRDERKGE